MGLLPIDLDKLRQDNELFTQISKREPSGLKMPQYIVKLSFNIRDIANIFSID